MVGIDIKGNKFEIGNDSSGAPSRNVRVVITTINGVKRSSMLIRLMTIQQLEIHAIFDNGGPMIKLNCQSVDQESAQFQSLDQYEDLQIFVTDEVDFSMNIPSSWFSMHLRNILDWIHSLRDTYYAYELDCDWGVVFSKEDTSIRIADWRGSNQKCWRVYSGDTTVTSLELASAISSYLDRLEGKRFHGSYSESLIVESDDASDFIRKPFEPPLEFFAEQRILMKELLGTIHESKGERIWLHGNHFSDSRFTNGTKLEDAFAIFSNRSKKFIRYALKEEFSTYRHFVSSDAIGFPPRMLECKQLLVPRFLNEQIVQLVHSS